MHSAAEVAAAKVVVPEKVEALAREIRAQGRSLATLNGSFDLLHAGHLFILYEAARQADYLLVALNTDRSIQQYKSPKRPIIPLEQRLEMIAALTMVDYVTWFEETDPRTLLTKVRPNVHVNGVEYGENCIEAEVVRAGGGRIHIVPLKGGLSTSQIVRKIVEGG